MGHTSWKRGFPVFLSAVILISTVSYGAQWEEDLVMELGGATIEQAAPGSQAPKGAAEIGQQEVPGASRPGEILTQAGVEGEVSCGIFEITGYCGCEICTGDNHLTYQETVPRAGHTVAADLQVFPLGTRLKIGGVIYTVEDTGASIKNNKIDIFYETHQEALEAGVRLEEVFRLESGDGSPADS